MIEKKLNLVQFAAGQMAKPRTCPSQIVRCQFVYAGSLGRSLDDLPKYLRRHALAPDRSRLVDRSKETTVLDSTCFGPAIECPLCPEWNWYRSNVPGLAVKVDDRPAVFSELNRGGRKGKEFTAPQTATNQQSENGVVAFAPKTAALGVQQQ